MEFEEFVKEEEEYEGEGVSNPLATSQKNESEDDDEEGEFVPEEDLNEALILLEDTVKILDTLLQSHNSQDSITGAQFQEVLDQTEAIELFLDQYEIAR